MFIPQMKKQCHPMVKQNIPSSDMAPLPSKVLNIEVCDTLMALSCDTSFFVTL
jgi:hypothetical protein